MTSFRSKNANNNNNSNDDYQQSSLPHIDDQLEDKPKPPMKVGENHFHVCLTT